MDNDVIARWKSMEALAKEDELHQTFERCRDEYVESIKSFRDGKLEKEDVEKCWLAKRDAFRDYREHVDKLNGDS